MAHADPELTRGFISNRRLGGGEPPEHPVQEKAARNRGIIARPSLSPSHSVTFD